LFHWLQIDEQRTTEVVLSSDIIVYVAVVGSDHQKFIGQNDAIIDFYRKLIDQKATNLIKALRFEAMKRQIFI
jgi:hypothetical protein